MIRRHPGHFNQCLGHNGLWTEVSMVGAVNQKAAAHSSQLLLGTYEISNFLVATDP